MYPLYTEKELITDSGLVGSWKDPDKSDETWTFEAVENRAYRLIHVDDKGNAAQFDVHLVQLGTNRFLDVQASDLLEGGKKMNSLAAFHLVPAHFFIRVDALGKELKMRGFSQKWLAGFLAENPQALAHKPAEETDGPIVLTANTAALQAFLRKHASGGAFPDEITLSKATAKQP